MKRIRILLGHYGSGKTNVAANFALALRHDGHPVSVIDLDIVNPYFRTADWSEEFSDAGIDLVKPVFANTNLDIPALPSQIYGLLMRRDRMVVMDVGGDDAGAIAMGQYAKLILEENDYEAYYVVNFMRPLTRTPEEALASLREIRDVAGIPITGIVNNTNLGPETTLSVIERGALLSDEFASMASVPLICTAVDKELVTAKIPGITMYGKNGIFYMKTKRFC